MKKCVECARKDIVIEAHKGVLFSGESLFWKFKDLLDYMFKGAKPKESGINKRLKDINKLVKSYGDTIQTVNDFTQRFLK